MSVITVFRSRLRDGAVARYTPDAEEIMVRARRARGFVDAKTFSADDGERVTIVTFADRTSHDAWRDDVEHRAAMQRGIRDYYAEYSIKVAEVIRESDFTANEET